jgi:hypothetical protein
VTFDVLILPFGYQEDRKGLTAADYDDDLDTRYVCPCHEFGVENGCVGVNMHLITVQFGPCEENGNSVWELRGLQRPAPHVEENMRHWSRKGHKRDRNQAIVLALGRKYRKSRSGTFIRVPALEPLGVPAETRWFIGTFLQIYLVLKYLIIEVTLFFSKFSICRYKFMYTKSCPSST